MTTAVITLIAFYVVFAAGSAASYMFGHAVRAAEESRARLKAHRKGPPSRTNADIWAGWNAAWGQVLAEADTLPDATWRDAFRVGPFARRRAPLRDGKDGGVPPVAPSDTP